MQTNTRLLFLIQAKLNWEKREEKHSNNINFGQQNAAGFSRIDTMMNNIWVYANWQMFSEKFLIIHENRLTLRYTKTHLCSIEMEWHIHIMVANKMQQQPTIRNVKNESCKENDMPSYIIIHCIESNDSVRTLTSLLVDTKHDFIIRACKIRSNHLYFMRWLSQCFSILLFSYTNINLVRLSSPNTTHLIKICFVEEKL